MIDLSTNKQEGGLTVRKKL